MTQIGGSKTQNDAKIKIVSVTPLTGKTKWFTCKKWENVRISGCDRRTLQIECASSNNIFPDHRNW